ncbi:MAG: DUF2085 domain-containing protein [Thermoplasmata archaeon]|nr:MAG: DUF2085 domain-containing protein [Thermoplasmata archaeon]
MAEAPPEAQPQPPPAAFMTEKWQWDLAPRPKVLYINLTALIILSIWAGLMWVTPFLNEPGTLVGLDGFVGVDDSPFDFEQLGAVSKFIYSAGDSQCHQKENRTVILNGNQMPFCARDVAIYTAMAVGVGLSVFPRMPYYDRINNLKWYWLVIALIPIGIDGTGQLLGYWESTNLMRFITGGLCGLVVGIALGFMLREVEGMILEGKREKRVREEWERMQSQMKE